MPAVVGIGVEVDVKSDIVVNVDEVSTIVSVVSGTVVAVVPVS